VSASRGSSGDARPGLSAGLSSATVDHNQVARMPRKRT
jgi:hypothetical protein